jgi:hypothetical protein
MSTPTVNQALGTGVVEAGEVQGSMGEQGVGAHRDVHAELDALLCRGARDVVEDGVGAGWKPRQGTPSARSTSMEGSRADLKPIKRHR